MHYAIDMIQWIITASAYYILSDHNKGKIGSHNETLYLAINCDVRSSLFGEYFEEKLVCNKEVPLQHRGGPGEGCTCNHRQNGDKQHPRFGKYITVYGSPKLYSGSNDI